MIPNNEIDKHFALTVVQEMDGQWKLKYSNKKNYDYNWCFSSDNGVFVIRWCGTTDKDTNFILDLDNNQLHLTSHTSDKLEPQHYFSNFYPLYTDNLYIL